MASEPFFDPVVIEQIDKLIADCGGNPDTFDRELVSQMIQTSLKLLFEGHDTGQLKLMSRALREMRYAYRVFNQYGKKARRLTIFGSARTPETHPDYLTCSMLGQLAVEKGWMVMTGGANGIMKAGLEGAGKANSFGLSIRLPFEMEPNIIIDGDNKSIMFRYFFTRKLMMVSHADALVAFPGGLGTQDELFEVLTLMQTGKSHIVPVVLLEGGNSAYWKEWESFAHTELLDKGWISPDDLNLYHIATSPQEALDHILHFYSNYHSSRYVKDQLVLRLQRTPSPATMEALNHEFQDLLVSGTLLLSSALPEENGEAEGLPRLVLHHNRRHIGKVRKLIDRINDART